MKRPHTCPPRGTTESGLVQLGVGTKQLEPQCMYQTDNDFQVLSIFCHSTFNSVKLQVTFNLNSMLLRHRGHGLTSNKFSNTTVASAATYCGRWPWAEGTNTIRALWY